MSNFKSNQPTFYQNHDDIVIKTAGSRVNRYQDVQPSELEDLQSYLQELQSEERKQKYLGLCNQGATCYMNSLLQALYMTPEFRQFIYSWDYNPDLHGNQEYSIPYQLQRLFAHLQMSRRRAVETRGLTKSFGWGANMSFVQHDAQELCRVLFDAIEQSYAIVGDQCTYIKDLYQGEIESYVKCEECGYESINQDKYLDLTLPIRNEDQFGQNAQSKTKARNSTSLEMALEIFLKPERLDGDNQYNCSQCQKKVNAIKGLKIKSTPKILTLQLNRFTMDYNTFQLVKVHDRVTFPFVLNMNDYLNGYDGIKNKRVDEMRSEDQSAKPQQTETFEYVKKQSVAFDVQMEDLSQSNQKDEASQSNIVSSGMTLATSNEDATMIDISIQSDNDKPRTGSAEQKTRHQKLIDEDILQADFIKGQSQISENFESPIKQNSSENSPLSLKEEQDIDFAQKQALDSKRRDIENKQKIQENLKEGDQVYELFAVLIHQGNQGSGHYYAYIRSFEKNENGISDWMVFNDQEVRKISEEDVERAYGQKYGDPTAYLLMYRRYEPQNEIIQISNELIKECYHNELQSQIQSLIKEQREVYEQMIQLTLKIYLDNQQENAELNYVEVNIKKTETLGELAKQALQLHGIDIQSIDLQNNFRFRAFDEKKKAKLTVYNQYDDTLLKLRFNYTTVLMIELKQSEQEFEVYDPDWIFIRVIKHDSNVDYEQMNPEIIQQHSQVIKVNKKLENIYDLDKKISQLYGIPEQKLVILMRVQFAKSGTVKSEVYNLHWRKSKTIEEGPRIDDSSFLFIEEGDTKDKNENFKWHQEFNKQFESLTININDPSSDPKGLEYKQQIQVRKSETLCEFKNKVGLLLNLNPEEIIVKRANNLAELKNLNWKMGDFNLIDGDKLKIEQGKPHIEGNFEINVSLIRLSNDNFTDDKLFETTFLFKLQINPNIDSTTLKKLIVEQYNDKNENKLDIRQVKVRVAKLDDFGDVLKDADSLENFDIFDGKQIYIQEIIPDRTFDFVNAKDPSNCYHVLFREWDPETWQYGPLYEVRIDKQAYLNKLAIFLADKVFPHISAESIQGCKVNYLSMFKRSELVLKRWNVLKSQATKIAQSAVKISKDSDYIIIKDSRKFVREDLTEEEMQKWSTPSYVTYLSKRTVKPKPAPKPIGAKSGGGIAKSTADAKIEIKKKVMASRANRPLEQAIKINVGGPKIDSESKQQSNDQKESKSNEEVEQDPENCCLMGSGVFMQV
ncbi:ubiquitin carboxyl-terminal hydrolase [Stylonychia lemnae]|uniref:Ubiquitin carboxyl-terminal hydrolase n=1 Tax=Stylonychia lemnae TaxID=5949 RepID=A0A078A1M3_STYLE|nr:ubiquitin carboxyl-terminal hydrolase [Stylonychia lemnae]|eukprot:CDW75353.1 ubiquitin carboxyl-terminal hydrolase [Stylonychia lemnae]